MDNKTITPQVPLVFSVILKAGEEEVDEFKFTAEDLEAVNGGLDWLREALVRAADIACGKMR